MSGQKLSSIGPFPPTVSTVASDRSPSSTDSTTSSSDVANVMSTGGYCNVSNETTSTESGQRNVLEPYEWFIYNPWLFVLDTVLVFVCVLTIIVIFRTTRFKDTASRFLLNKTMADMCFGLSFILLGIPVIMGSGPLPKSLLFAQKFIITLSHCESMLTLMMLLFSLHLAICSPIYFKLHCGTRYFLIFLLVSWTFNILCNCSIFLFELRDTDHFSSTIWSFTSRFSLPLTILYIVVWDIIPLLVITVCYIRVTIYIRQEDSARIFNQSATRTHVQQAKGVILIGIADLITVCPTHILDLLIIHVSEPDLKERLLVAMLVVGLLSYLFMILKFPMLLYGFRSYRRVFFSMFHCCESRLQGPGNVTTVGTGQRTNPEAAGDKASKDSGVGGSGSVTFTNLTSV